MMRDEERRDELVAGPPPGAGAVLLALAVGLATALGFTGVLRLFTTSLAIHTFLFEVAFLLGVVAYLSTRAVDVPRVLRLGPVPGAVYWPALKLGVALVVANVAAAALLGPPAREVEFVAEARTPLERVALVAGVAIAAPVIEEALFRGLIQGVLERRLHHWLAIGLAGAAFGALHGPESGAFFALWSLPVGWIVWRSGSVRPAIVVHGLNNLIGLMLLIIGRSAAPPEPVDLSPGDVAVIVGLLALMGLWAASACRQVAGRLEATPLGERRNPDGEARVRTPSDDGG
jgi:membrane protease YdiL (CAAX protease family)